MPIDYKKGKIYKIVNTENNNIYYGSTTQPLHKRLNEHRRQKHNSCMSKNLCVDLHNCSIVLVENFECNTREELLMRERFHIENNVCVNKYSPIKTKEEHKLYKKKWNDKNIDKRRIQMKQYQEKNKESINEYNKKRYREQKQWYKLYNFTLF